MVRLDVITTRGGDGGETSLGDNARVRKDAPRIEAIGAVDEANAAVGLLRLHTEGEEDALLARVQNGLFDLGADLCVPGEGSDRLRIDAAHVSALDEATAALNKGLPPLTSFVLPGGAPGAAAAHLARTVARRTERAVVRLAAEEAVNPEALRYLNRLSDLLFVLSRRLNGNGERDVLWQPGGGA
ncbi:MAG: cob(I)yrinic acid a,c-diamide adenosyltransferase [Acetobacteraceae bacterium]|nr:cob(I)yrinic acid a,c-diamide adenosyltransferase [Acetobacteraceae bacterium]